MARHPAEWIVLIFPGIAVPRDDLAAASARLSEAVRWRRPPQPLDRPTNRALAELVARFPESVEACAGMAFLFAGGVVDAFPRRIGFRCAAELALRLWAHGSPWAGEPLCAALERSTEAYVASGLRESLSLELEPMANAFMVYRGFWTTCGLVAAILLARIQGNELGGVANLLATMDRCALDAAWAVLDAEAWTPGQSMGIVAAKLVLTMEANGCDIFAPSASALPGQLDSRRHVLEACCEGLKEQARFREMGFVVSDAEDSLLCVFVLACIRTGPCDVRMVPEAVLRGRAGSCAAARAVLAELEAE